MTLCIASGCQPTTPTLEPTATQAATRSPPPPEAPGSESAAPKLLPTSDETATPAPTVAADTAATANTTATAPPQASAPPASKQAYFVAVMGDSLTDYKSGGGKFIRFLEERCPESSFDNYGKGGEMVNQMRRRFDALFTPDKPQYTHVIVFGGVNDLYSDLTAHRTNERIESDLSAMYTAAKNHGAQVVAINVAPWGGFKKYFNPRRGASTLALNAWIDEQVGHGVDAVIDAHSLLRCGDPDALCPGHAKPFKDGIHFGPEGHRILGQALFEAVFRDCR